MWAPLHISTDCANETHVGWFRLRLAGSYVVCYCPAKCGIAAYRPVGTVLLGWPTALRWAYADAVAPAHCATDGTKLA